MTVWIIFLCTSLIPAQETLQAVPAERLPDIDGDASDAAWKGASPLALTIGRSTMPGKDKLKCTLRAVYDKEAVCFLMEWEDKTEDRQHKPFLWDAKAKAYVEGEQLEDQFSLSFPIKGEFTADMFSPIEAVWDVWQWGAARTDGVGYAKDKSHIMTLKKPKEGKRFTARNNEDLWIVRKNDKGTAPTKSNAPPKNKGADTIPQYEPQEPSGSAADVRAKGRWKAGRWTLELRRGLSANSSDEDARFDPKKETPFGIAIFDHEADINHRVSGKLTLKFQ